RDERIAAGDAHTRLLVHLEADAVPETVDEALFEDLARLLGHLRLVAVLLEQLARADEELTAGHARLDRAESILECLQAELLVLDDLLRRLADDVRAGHVRKARR